MIQYIVFDLKFLSKYLTALTVSKTPSKTPHPNINIPSKYSKFNFNICFTPLSIGTYNPNIKSIVEPDMPGNTIADIAIIPDVNIYAINIIFKLSYFIEKL